MIRCLSVHRWFHEKNIKVAGNIGNSRIYFDNFYFIGRTIKRRPPELGPKRFDIFWYSLGWDA